MHDCKSTGCLLIELRNDPADQFFKKEAMISNPNRAKGRGGTGSIKNYLIL